MARRDDGRWTTRALAGAAALAVLACGRPAGRDAPAGHAPEAGGRAETAAGDTGTPAPAAGTRVVLLGTGTPRPDPDRSGPSTAVLAGGTAYLFDAGPGVVRRAAAAALQGRRELEPRALSRVCLTHLHSDHTLGLPDLIFSPWTVGRTVPLQAWGPPGLLVLTHQLWWPGSGGVETLLEEVRRGYDGPTANGRDLDVY